MDIHQILIKNSDAGLNKQKADGSMPPGNNGPWGDPETPVRNTSHWLITFLKAYEITKGGKYLNAAKKAVDYLLSKKTRPHGFTFHYRNNPKKNKCSALIGQAWTLEALIAAGEKLNKPDLISLAEEIFLMHHFDKKRGLWHMKEIDGKNLPIDTTFNHQLWFAAIGSMLTKYSKNIADILQIFMNKFQNNISIHSSGLILHHAKLKFLEGGLKKYHGTYFYRKKNYTINFERAIGYFSFNLYAFALLKDSYPKHKFWQSKEFNKILNYLISNEYKEKLIHNIYGYPYNVAGIEIAFIMQKFIKDSKNLQKEWLQEQFKKNYDFKNNLMNLNTADPETLAARIYEATRLNNIVI